MDISFCDRCNSSIPRSDLERGVSRRVGVTLLCAPCLAKARRAFLTRTVILPLAILVAAAAGAVGAVLVLTPRLSTLESRLASLKVEVQSVPAPESVAAKEVGIAIALTKEHGEALQELGRDVAGRDEILSKAVAELGGKIDALAGEVRLVKARLAEMTTEPPANTPDNGGGEAELDVETAFSLLDHPEALMRLSALRRLRDVEDDRLPGAAVTALFDGSPFMRALAALIVGRVKARDGIPRLIELLTEGPSGVQSAANQALVAITGVNFGFDPTEPDEEKREKAVQAYRDWWRSKGK